tara:strand:- start:278 stop:742 length:465 start_codon:yes stop_codon:yes gene_type:complete
VSTSVHVDVSSVTLSSTPAHVNNEGELTAAESNRLEGVAASFIKKSDPRLSTVAVILKLAFVAINLVSGVTPTAGIDIVCPEGNIITNCDVVPTAELNAWPVTAIRAPPRIVPPDIADVTAWPVPMCRASAVVCDENPASEKAANPNTIHPSMF